MRDRLPATRPPPSPRPAPAPRSATSPGSAEKASASRPATVSSPARLREPLLTAAQSRHLVEHRRVRAALDRRRFDLGKARMASALARRRRLKPLRERLEHVLVELLLERHDQRRQLGGLGPFPGAEFGVGRRDVRRPRPRPGSASGTRSGAGRAIALPHLADQIVGQVVEQFAPGSGRRSRPCRGRCRSPPRARAARRPAASSPWSSPPCGICQASSVAIEPLADPDLALAVEQHHAAPRADRGGRPCRSSRASPSSSFSAATQPRDVLGRGGDRLPAG